MLSEQEQWTKFYDKDLPNGLEFELLFGDAWSACKLEFKRDKKAYRSGNVFIEYKSRGQPSGLATTQADLWIIGLDNGAGKVETGVLASVRWLKTKCRPYLGTGRDVLGGDNQLSQGILLPLDEFMFRLDEST